MRALDAHFGDAAKRTAFDSVSWVRRRRWQKAVLALLFALGAASLSAGLFGGSKQTSVSLLGFIGLLLCFALSGNQRLFCLWGLALTAPLGVAKSFYISSHMGGAAAIKFELVDVFLLPLLIFVLRDYAKGRRPRLHVTPMLRWWGALILLGVADLVLGPLRHLALLEIIRMTTSGVLLFVLVNELVRVRQMMHFVAALAVGVLLQSIIAIIQHTLKVDLGLQFLGEPVAEATQSSTMSVYLGTADIYRAGGLFSHPNLLAGYLAMLLPILIAMSFSRAAPIFKAGLGLTIAPALLALVFTLSRSGWTSFAAAFTLLLLFSMFHQKLRLRYVFLRIVVIGAILTAGALASSAIIRRFTESDPGAVKFRFDMMDTSWRMIADHPLFGMGINSFVAYFPLYAPRPGVEAVQQVYGDIWPIVHDAYLVTWTEQGTVGFICLMAVYISTLWTGYKTTRVMIDDLVYAMNVGACCGIVANMVDGIASFLIDEDAGQRIFIMQIALIAAANLWTRANGRVSKRGPRSGQSAPVAPVRLPHGTEVA